MKYIAFVAGFIVVASVASPLIAAKDSEPLGAEMSLYFLSGLLLTPCAAVFAHAARVRVIPHAWLVAGCVGALNSGLILGCLAMTSAVNSLSIAFVAGGLAAAATAWALPRLFRLAPNNSFKPTPLRGAA